MRRDLLIDQLDESNQKIGRVDKYLNGLAKKHPGVTLLKTIPGVGPRTAETLAAYLDDVTRFTRIKQVGAYFGLVPCQDASGDKNRLGHITRDGPGTVRKLLCEAAWAGVRRSPTVKSFYERVRHEDPDRKKIAIVATMHYLARVAASMLKSGECWRERIPVETTPASGAPGGGGETPSRPQVFSPPPGTTPAASAGTTPPPLSASPFSPQGRQEGAGPKPRTRTEGGGLSTGTEETTTVA